MKKIIFAIMLAVLTLTLFACQLPFDLPEDDNGNNNTPEPPSEYTVTFDTQAGYDIDAQTVKPGETCKKPLDPSQKGCRFIGWYLGDEVWNFATDAVTDNITLTAKWDLVEYKITYDLKGGTYNGVLQSVYTIESETIVLGEPTKDGCRFAGWYQNGKLVTEIPKGSTKDIALVADYYGPEAVATGSATASVRTWDNDSNITVRLTDTADTQSALTVKINFTKPWDTVKVTVGDEHEYVKTYMEGDELMLDIEMVPNGDDAVITPVILLGETNLVSIYGTILTDGTKIDTNYFPGFVRKAVTFTIDDGNLAMDEKFISIVKPAGIVGTFNLINTNAATAAKYLALYEGFEVASHHQLHCLPVRDGLDFNSLVFKDEVFSSSTADTDYVYKSNTDGLYYIDYSYYSSGTPSSDPNYSPYWHPVATDETYENYIDITKTTIENLFGEGSVVGFAYPHGKYNETVKSYLEANGYLYARATTASSPMPTDFALPKDRYCWVYNADASNLNEKMAQFDALSDDGELKFFAFGVHAVDYDGKWYVLESFAKNYGNRPEDFWYASNRDIFEYEDAVKALEIYDDKIVNPSDIDVFVTINNEKTIIYANSTYEL